MLHSLQPLDTFHNIATSSFTANSTGESTNDPSALYATHTGTLKLILPSGSIWTLPNSLQCPTAHTLLIPYNSSKSFEFDNNEGTLYTEAGDVQLYIGSSGLPQLKADVLLPLHDTPTTAFISSTIPATPATPRELRARRLQYARERSANPAPANSPAWPPDLQSSADIDVDIPTIPIPVPSTTPSALQVLNDHATLLQAHATLHHRNLGDLSDMQRLNTISNFPNIKALKHNSTKCVCPSCLIMNAKRANSPARILRLPTHRKRSSFSFDRFTSPTRSVDNMKYGLFLIDNLTKRLWVWLLVTKTEAEFHDVCIAGPNGLISILQQAHASYSSLTVEINDDPIYNRDFLVPSDTPTIETPEIYNPTYATTAPTGPSAPLGQIGSTIDRAHTDNEPSFITQTVVRELSKFGVQVTTTSVHTPVNNSYVERVQGTIAAATRASMHYAHVPEELWSDHVRCNVVTYNCMLHSLHKKLYNRSKKTKNHNIPPFLLAGFCPYQIDTGVKPDFNRLLPPSIPGVAFRGAAPASADYNTRRKWDARGVQGIFAFYGNTDHGIPRKIWVRQTDGLPLIDCIKDPSSPFHKPIASGHFNPDPTFSLAAENSPAKANVVLKRDKLQTLQLLSKIPQALLDHDPPFQDKLIDNGNSRLPSVSSNAPARPPLPPRPPPAPSVLDSLASLTASIPTASNTSPSFPLSSALKINKTLPAQTTIGTDHPRTPLYFHPYVTTYTFTPSDPASSSTQVSNPKLSSPCRQIPGTESTCPVTLSTKSSPIDQHQHYLTKEIIRFWSEFQSSTDDSNDNPDAPQSIFNNLAHPSLGLRVIHNDNTPPPTLAFSQKALVSILQRPYTLPYSTTTTRTFISPEIADSTLCKQCIDIAPSTRHIADSLNAFSAFIPNKDFASSPPSIHIATPSTETEATLLTTNEIPHIGPRHPLFKQSDFDELNDLITSGAITPICTTREEARTSNLLLVPMLVIRKMKPTSDPSSFTAKSRFTPRGDLIPYSDNSSSSSGLPPRPDSFAPAICETAKRVFFNLSSSSPTPLRELVLDFKQAFAQPRLTAEDPKYTLIYPTRFHTKEISNLLVSTALPLSPSSPKASISNIANIYLKLNCYLYGLPEAARKWHTLLRSHIIRLGYHEHPVWQCFYRRIEDDTSKSYLALHVDDLLGHNSNPTASHIESLYADLSKVLDAKPPHPLDGTLFLGVRYTKNSDGSLTADQHDYITTLASRFPLPSTTRQNPTTILPPDFDIGRTLESSNLLEVAQLEQQFNTKYTSLTGSFIYLLTTREDLRTAAVFLSTHNIFPGKSHFLAAYHFLSYVLSTKYLHFNFAKPHARTHRLYSISHGYPQTPKKHVRYIFSPRLLDGSFPPPPHGLPVDSSGHVEVFAGFDAEHKTHTNGKAILSHGAFLGGSLLTLVVHIPKLTAQDTTCAEGQAASLSARYLNYLIPNLSVWDIIINNPSDPPPVTCDNKSLVDAITHSPFTPVPNVKTHIRLSLQLLHDLHHNHSVHLHHVYSQRNPFDIGTKVLPKLPHALHTCTILNIEQTDFPAFANILQPLAEVAAQQQLHIDSDSDEDSSFSPLGGGDAALTLTHASPSLQDSSPASSTVPDTALHSSLSQSHVTNDSSHRNVSQTSLQHLSDISSTTLSDTSHTS